MDKDETKFTRMRPYDGVHDNVEANRVGGGSLTVVVYLIIAAVLAIAAIAFFIVEVA